MTIIRTPRKWPGYRTHRRVKAAGKVCFTPDIAGRRDFSTIVMAARLAVQARNNGTYDASTTHTVLRGRDWVDVEAVHPESGTVVVDGFMGFERLPMSALVVTP
jgi:hypothetical protein